MTNAYPCVRFSPARRPADRAQIEPPLRLLRRLDDVAYIPRVDGSRVFVPLASGALAAHDEETGETLWRRELGSGYVPVEPHEGAPLLHGGRVLVRRGTQLHSLDPETGRSDEPLPCPEVSLEAGVVLDGVLIAELDDDEGSFLAAFDLDAGELRWRVPRSGFTPVLAGDDGVVVAWGGSGSIVGHDAATGTELWRCRVDRVGAHDDLATGAHAGAAIGIPTCLDGAAVIPVLASHVLAVDLRTGSVRWEAEVPVRNPFNLTADADGRLYALDHRFLVILDARTGAQLAVHEVRAALAEAGSHWLLAGVGVTREHVLGVDMQGIVVALRKDDGALGWSHPLGAKVALIFQPVFVGERAYVLDLDGGLHIFGSQ